MDALVLALLMFFAQAQTQTQSTTSTTQQTTTSPGTTSQSQDQPGAHDARTTEESSAQIHGIVTIGRKPAKGAIITIFDAATNYARSARTDNNGYYEFKNLAATGWTVEAAVGDNKQQRNITVRQRETSNLDFVLDDPNERNQP